MTNEEEFNLSEKIFDCRGYGCDDDYIFIEDVKEFIKRLKEAVSPPNYYGDMMSPSNVIEEIDKLAGEKLR